MADTEHSPSGFFILRTPLLPYRTLTDLGAGLRATTSENALAEDRKTVLERMRQLAADSMIREALFVASPSLDNALTSWLADPASQRGRDVPETFFRYLSRMAARPTPFGLFSGCSVGHLTTEHSSHLDLPGRRAYRRHTRLDMHYLTGLAQALEADETVQRKLHFRPSSGIYPVVGWLRYAESQLDPASRALNYHLVAVERSRHLERALTRAAAPGGATLEELAATIHTAEPAISVDRANEFVRSLVAAQILVSDIAPPITGLEPIEAMLESLGRVAPALLPTVAYARRALRELDEDGVGQKVERYRAIAARLDELPTEPELARLFHVDLYKPSPVATLGRAVTEAIEEAIDLMAILAPSAPDEAMRAFTEAFLERYEDTLHGAVADREMIPLCELLDDESGLGFAGSGVTGGEPSPLLEGLEFPPQKDGAVGGQAFGAREDRLLRGIVESARAGVIEWTLTDDDVDVLRSTEDSRGRLPDCFAFMGAISASSAEAFATGNVRVYVESLPGPSGALLLGRFCHGDPELRREVEAHLRAEEALRPDAVFAEIVHLGEGRVGNILARPRLRDYEIPYLGHSGAPDECQIPITDLRVTMEAGRFVLFSKRLGREVVPRLTTAHGFAGAPLTIYRFLCALQRDRDRGLLTWRWGALGNSPFLPRVVRGRTVLSPARWNLTGAELAPLAAKDDVGRFRAAQALRAGRGLPRYVGLADGDNILPVDLDNVVSVASLAALVCRLEAATFVEILSSLDELIVRGPEGSFVHELIVPFVRRRKAVLMTAAAPPPSAHPPAGQQPAANARPSDRSFPPGAEWLYAKIYTGTTGADAVLSEIVTPLIAEARGTAKLRRWFFIRYADPHWHVRLRIQGEPSHMWSSVLPSLRARVAHFIADRSVWKLSLDTYDRETERYGGDLAIESVEALFEADSDAVVAALHELNGDTRWQLALRGCHELLLDLGLDLASRTDVAERARLAFGSHGPETLLDRQLGARFRSVRASLETLLQGPAFSRRSEQSRLAMAELRARGAGGELTKSLPEIAPALLHMHCNRIFRSEHRRQELVLYDLLHRLYVSEGARARSARVRSVR